jgi:hypothetical protein
MTNRRAISKFQCTTCSRWHDSSEISFGADSPVPWRLATDEERAGGEINADLCTLVMKDGRHYFIRGCLDIPIKDGEGIYTWGVWASLSENSFREVFEHWEDPNRVEFGPYFGWLMTSLPGYPNTLSMKSMVHQREVGRRPFVELEPTDHPLAVQQREGISRRELNDRIRRILHESKASG